jgi:hypothetical protein
MNDKQVYRLRGLVKLLLYMSYRAFLGEILSL